MHGPLTPGVNWTAQHPPAVSIQHTFPPNSAPLTVSEENEPQMRTDMFYKGTVCNKYFIFFFSKLFPGNVGKQPWKLRTAL